MPKYKQGSDREIFRSREKWKNQCVRVFEKRGNTCFCCESEASDCHHLTNHFPYDNTPDNFLLPVCRECHNKMPKYTSNGPVSAHVEPGRYNFEVIEATNCVSKTSKNQQIKLKLGIEGGVTLYDYLVFEKKSFWKIDQFRVATGDDLETNSEVDFDASDCTGRFGFANLTVETWEGKTRNKVAEYLIEEKKAGGF